MPKNTQATDTFTYTRTATFARMKSSGKAVVILMAPVDGILVVRFLASTVGFACHISSLKEF